jgi:protein TonB
MKTTIKFTAPAHVAAGTRARDVENAMKRYVKFTAPKIEKDVNATDGKQKPIKSTVKFTAPTIISYGNDSVYYGVEQMPQFPGGDEEMMKFIKDNLHYPPVAVAAGIEGRLTIRFVVSRDGDVTDVKVIRGIDAACDKEAVRVVKLMPKWIPGRQEGRNVPVFYTLPIVYKLPKINIPYSLFKNS